MFCQNCLLAQNARIIIFSKMIWRGKSILQHIKRPMQDIPSPKGLPIIGTTCSLLMAGSSPKLHKYIDKRHKKLGPIFREKIGAFPCIFLSDPEAMRSVFAHEGKYPMHILPEAWTTYNSLNGVTRGLFFMDGEEWLHYRKILNPLLLKGDQSWLEDSCTPAVDGLVEKIKEISRRNLVCTNIEEVLYQWSLEVIMSVLIGPTTYLKNRQQLETQINFLASNVHLIFQRSAKLSLIPAQLASKFRISQWRKFENSVTIALSSAAKLVKDLLENYTQTGDGLLGKLKNELPEEDIVKIVTDLILAAGDTTSYEMEWVLYAVSKNRHVSETLRNELTQCKIRGQKYTSNAYLKSIVKESLRLYPVAPFLTRILPEPVSLLGYDIPGNNIFILSIFTTGRDANNFQDPLKFDPNRWMGGHARSGIAHSSSLPFAIGARSCIGKKLAETQLQLTLAKLVENFDFEVRNKRDVDVILKMVAVPDQPIEFKFLKL